MKHLKWYQKFWFYVAAIISCGLSVYIFNLGKIAEDKIILEENTKNEEKKQAAKLLTALQNLNLQYPNGAAPQPEVKVATEEEAAKVDFPNK